MHSATIDDMREGDLEAAVTIDLASFHPSELGVGAGPPRLVREKSLREELARPWGHLRAARDEAGTLVGYLLFWHVVDELHLLNVAVVEEARRRGIGRSLMADLLGYAKAHGIARILLEVRATNAPAIAMYRALGFTEFNVRARYYADGEDASEMSLSL
ncbi:MAG: Ribosomal-protein-S18p-alanine acetyltransferase [Labilithrix sp.]|nr:Ribosomal-protein-S18p-alanine acetyltransferase [Labilithrix sp.]